MAADAKAVVVDDPDELALSARQTVVLIGQHLACPRSELLPAILVTAARRVLIATGRRTRTWPSGTTGEPAEGLIATGFTVDDDDRGRTVYEMTRKATVNELDRTARELTKHPERVDNYFVISTSRIDPQAADYATSLYAATGTEFAVLDCLGFARHFLHLFHRHRAAFLDTYQELVLGEPESAVSFDLKQAFLALRQASTPTADP